MSKSLRLFCAAARIVGLLLLASLLIPSASAQRIYLANDNHTDYGWNATAEQYDSSMLAELDYYLDRIDATANGPSDEQTRFNADCWWYLRLYEMNRTRAQFQRLIHAIHSGHLTIPLNPFVELFGALPTEAAIRAGYYPGQIERRFGVSFPIANYMENTTIPWGLASIWAGSGVRYSWKGICGCNTQAPFGARTDEVFHWRGPDQKTLLMKWYQFVPSPTGWGTYLEAAENTSTTALPRVLALARQRQPGIPVIGLFGYGGDAVIDRTTVFEDTAHAWNKSHAIPDHVVVSNEIDYFQDVESRQLPLPTLTGGWGNEWDLQPAALAERTAQVRRAVEQLHGAEALSALVEWQEPHASTPWQEILAGGFTDLFKFYEHDWLVARPIPLSYLVENRKARAQHMDEAVSAVDATATASARSLFQTPTDEDRFVVFNPLGFVRSDIADVPVTDPGPWIVTDVVSRAQVPCQNVARHGAFFIQLLASDVPSLGWRTYRLARGTPLALADAAVVRGNQVENQRYRVALGPRGQILSAFDKVAARDMTTHGMNDPGSGSDGTASAENVGPVSATLRMDVVDTPARRVRVTLFRGVDRIEIEDEILGPRTDATSYRFQTSLDSPQIRFEEVGAIARPGLLSQGGDFLPGTRSDFMTLNHFVSFARPDYAITLSNWDAFAMKVGQSGIQGFDLPTSEVSVLALGNVANSGIPDQGGDSYFRDRFALKGTRGAWSGPDAMRTSLAHQNPLRTLTLARDQAGPLRAPVSSLLSVSDSHVVITAFKPAEDPGRGIVVRAWELGGAARSFSFDASTLGVVEAFETSLIETEKQPVPLKGERVQATIGAQEIKTWRLVATPPTGPRANSGSGPMRRQGGSDQQVPSPALLSNSPSPSSPPISR